MLCKKRSAGAQAFAFNSIVSTHLVPFLPHSKIEALVLSLSEM